MDVAKPTRKNTKNWQKLNVGEPDWFLDLYTKIVQSESKVLLPCLNGDSMMRLHEMQVRMTPVLWWAITGTSSSTKAHVITTTIGVSTMVIPDGDSSFTWSKIAGQKSFNESVLRILPLSSHAFLLGTHIMSRWSESFSTTSLIIPVFSSTTPLPASVPLPVKVEFRRH